MRITIEHALKGITVLSLVPLVLLCSRYWSSPDIIRGISPPRSDLKDIEAHIPESMTVLAGVFTLISRVERRRVLRDIYNDLRQNLPVNYNFLLRFVVGEPVNAAEEVILQREMVLHNDIIYLDTPENMNHGKTYHFYHKLSSEKQSEQPRQAHDFSNIHPHQPYDYVLKVDDDSYVHVPNLLHSLYQYSRRFGVYYGRICNREGLPSYELGWPYMCGMAYALSWDLVRWIATSGIAHSHQRGPTEFEDANTGYWLWSGNKTRHIVDEGDKFFHLLTSQSENGSLIHSSPKHDSIIIHDLKSESALQDVARFYASPLRQTP